MNWKLLFLILLALGHGYRLLLQIVNYRSASNPIPENVADVYDSDTYHRWRQYSAEKARLGIFSNILSFALTALLLCFNAHAAVAKLFCDTVTVQLIVVITFHALVEWLVDLGIQYWNTMVIEQKYGFNRTTVKTFSFDQLRSLILEVFLSVGLMGILGFLHLTMGDWVILLFTGFLFCFTLLISFLYPIFSRIGNKFVPLEDGELKERLMDLLTRHGYKVKAIEVMDASRRTTKLNAYFTGFGKLKTIVLYDNLLNAMSPDEICAVFAHELGHGLHKDVLKQQIMNLGNLLIMAVVVWLVVKEPAMHAAFGFDSVNYGFANLLMSIGLGLVQPITGIAMAAYSRHAEYRADRQAVAEGYGPALITGLKKLGRENFVHLAPSSILVALEYSHPPLSQRIAAVEAATKNSC